MDSTTLSFALALGLAAGVQAQPPTVGLAAPALTLVNALSGANRGAFYVYENSDSGFNNGFASGFFPGGSVLSKLHLDTACVYDSTSPNGCTTDINKLDRVRGTVTRVTFDPLASGEFVGLNWEQPENYGATLAGIGHDLRGATRVCFEAISPTPSLKVRLGVNPHLSAFMSIPNQWTSMCLDLAALGLSSAGLANMHFLFTIVTNDQNASAGGTVLLDRIRFEPVPDALKTSLSFPLANPIYGVVPVAAVQPGRVKIPPDQILGNLTTIYESAMAVLVLLARGSAQDLASARLIADSFVYALNNDNQGLPIPPSPDSSRGLHSAYSSGNIALLNDQAPGSGRAGQVRLAGFSIASSLCGPSRYCLVLDGATGGNNAFALMALAAAYKQFGDVRYLNAARSIGNWIYGNLLDTTGTGFGGYYLGYPDEGQPKVLQTGKSIENNADIFRAFSTLGGIVASQGARAEAQEWNRRAKIAGDFVMTLFDPAAGRFYAGTVPPNVPPSDGIAPDGPRKGNDIVNTYDFLDAQTFTILPMAADPLYRNAIDWRRPVQWMLNHYAVTVTAGGRQFRGFNLQALPTSGPNGIAWEFTGQAVLTMRFVDALYGQQQFEAQAQFYLNEIRSAQQFSPFSDGQGLVAATIHGGDLLPPYEQCLSTAFQCIASRIGLAATTWGIAADLNVNPFEGPAAQPPTLVSVTPPSTAAVKQTFIVTARDGNGFGDIQRIYFLVNTSAVATAGTCHGFYDRLSNSFFLYNDALSALVGPLTPGTPGTLQNSQCAINGAASSAAPSGTTDFVLNLSITRKGTYATGNRNFYIWVTDNSNAGTGWVLGSVWNIVPQPPPTLDPPFSMAVTQIFTLTERDGNGSADIQRVYFSVNTTPSIPPGICHGFYDRASNGIYLYDYTLTTLMGPLTPGTPGTLQSSRCVINGAASSVSAPGTDLVLNLSITRRGADATGDRKFFVWVTDAANTWMLSSIWNIPPPPPVPPAVVSVTPTAAAAVTQTFTVTTGDSNGSADINRVYFLVETNPSIPTGSCHGFYDRAGDAIFLYNDALSAVMGPLAPGMPGTIQNSQCVINGAASSATASGTNVVLNLNITRQGSYATGNRYLYIWVVDNAASGTGWVLGSGWNIPSGAQAPSLVSVVPASTVASTQTFTIRARDLNGYADINRFYFLVNANTSIPAGSCHGFYDRASNSLFLYNDALSALTGPLTLGAVGTLQNSQCMLHGLTSSATASGADVVLNLTITLRGAYATGAWNLYIWVNDNVGLGTGWVQGSAWNLGSAVPPTLAAATPASTTTATQTFTLTGRDGNGFADIQRFYFVVNTNPSVPTGSCHGFYDRASNSLFLYNDAVTALTGPLALGVASSLQNSQCAINGAASSATVSGTDVVLNLNITRQGTYATGARNLYIWVTDSSGAGTGWVQASTWTL